MDFSPELELGTQTYVVYRDVAPGEQSDPTSPISFFPPKDSDELFDALRIALPHLKTHAERMRDAVIQFLLEERIREQSEPSPAMTMDASTTTWPFLASGSTSSTFSSPELANFGSFANSPQVFPTPLTRQVSSTTSSQNSPPSLDQMTGVFSLSTSSQTKQRTRRKMTEAEKIEYQKRRIVKACDKCAKRKRKCTHNQAEMQTLPKSTPKVAKPEKLTKSSKTSTSPPQLSQYDNSFALDGMDTDFLPGTSFTGTDFDMFANALPELAMDEFINFDHFQHDHVVPHTHQQDGQRLSSRHPILDPWSDFTLLDPILHDHDHSSSHERASRSFVSAGPIDSASTHQNVDANKRASTQVSEAQPMTSSQHCRGDQQPNSVREALPSGARNAYSSPHGEPQQVPGRPRRPTPRSQFTMLPSDATSRTTLNGQAHASKAEQLFRNPGTETVLRKLDYAEPGHNTLPERNAQGPIRTGSQQPDQQGSSQTTQPPTLGEGIKSHVDLSAEMFRLRRSISSRPRNVAGRGSLTGSSSLSAVATTTPRLQTIASPSSAPLSSRTNIGVPPHTMTNDQHDVRLALTNTRTAHVQARASAHAACSSSYQGTAHAASPSGFHGGASLSPSHDRLSDHVRYRDRHGRPSPSASEGHLSDISRLRRDHNNGKRSSPAGLPGQNWAAAAVALGVLFLAVTFFSPSVSISMAVLASLQPKSTSFAQLDLRSESGSDESMWNETLTSSSTTTRDRTLKMQQHLRGYSAWAGFGLFRAGAQGWVTGLMFSFDLSPMRFQLA